MSSVLCLRTARAVSVLGLCACVELFGLSLSSMGSAASLSSDDPSGQAADAHDNARDHTHAHGPGEMNWFYGFLGEKQNVEPNLLWRSPGTPVPFAANLINFAVFAYIVVRLGKKPLKEALVKRKQTIMAQIDEATDMKQQAEERLADYENKLAHIDAEVERIKNDFAAKGEREKQRLIREATEKKHRMLQDAQFIVQQEQKHMRNVLMREVVEQAIAQAEATLMRQVTSADHERVIRQYIEQIAANRPQQSGGLHTGFGGGAQGQQAGAR